MDEPFHNGEIALQELTGERDKAILNGRLIGFTVPAAARAFVSQQTYCALAWTDDAGVPWVALIEGQKGFAQSNADGSMVSISHSGRYLPWPVDTTRIAEERRVGMLFLEFATRRRLRVNGVVAHINADSFQVSVQEAFPNCPKYIQKRTASVAESAQLPSGGAHGAHGVGVPHDMAAWLKTADTMFVASLHPERGVDCSHRGGSPGFMRLDEDVIRIPDYPGNSMFGTLGNISVNPQAGLCILDFERNLQLQLTGLAQLQFGNTPSEETAGTGRWWTFRPQRWSVSPLVSHFQWELKEASPYNP